MKHVSKNVMDQLSLKPHQAFPHTQEEGQCLEHPGGAYSPGAVKHTWDSTTEILSTPVDNKNIWGRTSEVLTTNTAAKHKSESAFEDNLEEKWNATDFYDPMTELEKLKRLCNVGKMLRLV